MEVNVMRELRHPNIVRYVDRMINKRRHLLYILMEYCDAGDLAENMREFHKQYAAVDEKVILDIALQLLFALAYCHNCQLGTKNTRILHRDLKPQNIFLSTTKRGYTCKIGDFGLCRHIGMDSFAHSCVGTPYYWCPELLLTNFKNYNDKMDMWALGCVLYELSSGKTPFHKATTLAELVSCMKAGVPLPLHNRSRDLNYLLNMLLQPNPARRPSALQCLGYSIWKEPATLLFIETLEPTDRERMSAIISPGPRKMTENRDWYTLLIRAGIKAQDRNNFIHQTPSKQRSLLYQEYEVDGIVDSDHENFKGACSSVKLGQRKGTIIENYQNVQPPLHTKRSADCLAYIESKRTPTCIRFNGNLNHMENGRKVDTTIVKPHVSEYCTSDCDTYSTVSARSIQSPWQNKNVSSSPNNFLTTPPHNNTSACKLLGQENEYKRPRDTSNTCSRLQYISQFQP
ncbi:bifunctional Protein kinase domain/Protein kinase-like domain superfamily/Serine-threonine-protein kinase [Babesia duncani]|uniref:non-specific serine/threonine protein kinase n=1 Tax=Babesia duncani TaxID=323732 RepID=A0AAD9PIK8_9APIC|nr:bifunctional Protein kinase domain/Protein kinase-like domain superfamily/Serine-threonine-protein kinase [Babesia duncani]